MFLILSSVWGISRVQKGFSLCGGNYHILWSYHKQLRNCCECHIICSWWSLDYWVHYCFATNKHLEILKSDSLACENTENTQYSKNVFLLLSGFLLQICLLIVSNKLALVHCAAVSDATCLVPYWYKGTLSSLTIFM